MSSSSTEAGGTRGSGSAAIYIFGALGGLNWGYDTGVISAAIVYINQDFNLSPFMTGWVVSSLIVGAMFGAAIGGRLNDSLGRWKVLLITALIFTVGPFGLAFAPGPTVLVIFRLVLGLSAGLASVTLPVYLSEIAPSRIRGAVTAFYALAIVTGQFIGFVAGAIFSQSGAWRWMLGLAVVPAVLFLIGLFFIWETPRWLVKQHREEEAWEVLRYDRDEEAAQSELNEIREMERVEEEEGVSSWREFLAPWVRPMLIVGIGLAILQQIMGINTIIYYTPTTLTNVGFGEQGAIIANVAIGVLNIIAVLLAIRYADRMGRKPLLWIGAIGTTVALGVLAITSLTTAKPTGIGPVGIITIVCLGAYIFFFQGSWGSIVWVMLGEIFPLGIRAAAMGVATVLLWGANFVVAITFPPLLAALGVGGLFLIYAFICLAAVCFVWFLVPETKGQSLEQIETDLREA
ncbi:MAG: sugar porter family MFS transporter, partial [Rubrobacteraceae bacterium]